MSHVGRLQEQFNQNKIVNKVTDCKPLGYKSKAALPGDVKVGKVEAKVGKVEAKVGRDKKSAS